MTREQVLTLIREHLADELDVDPQAIAEGTRFKEDLEADSLDLYTLVQELEDIYGVRMSDEQAARILTVGAAVDFVLAHSAFGSGRPKSTPRTGRIAPIITSSRSANSRKARASAREYRSISAAVRAWSRQIASDDPSGCKDT